MKLTMAHFSDLHYSEVTKTKDMKRIAEALNFINPNYIFFTGDLLDENRFMEANSQKKEDLLKWLEEITKIYKLIMIKGNHDELSKGPNGWYPDSCDSFWSELASIENLYYSSDVLKYGDANISVCGINLPDIYYENSLRKEDVNSFMQYLSAGTNDFASDNDKLKVLLIHSPLFVTDNRARDCMSKFDLVLCGHMHNGLVPSFVSKIIPGNRGLIGPLSKLFPPNARGQKSFNCGGKIVNLSISSGITKLSASSNLSLFNLLYPMEVDKISYDKNAKDISVKRLTI